MGTTASAANEQVHQDEPATTNEGAADLQADASDIEMQDSPDPAPETQEASSPETQDVSRPQDAATRKLPETPHAAEEKADSDGDSVVCLGSTLSTQASPTRMIANASLPGFEPIEAPAARPVEWTLWSRDGISDIQGSTPLMKILTDEFPFFMAQSKCHSSNGWTQTYKCSANCSFAVLVQCEYGSDDDGDIFRLFLSPKSCTCGKMRNNARSAGQTSCDTQLDRKPSATKKRSMPSPSAQGTPPRKRARNYEDDCWKDEKGISIFVGDDALDTALRKCHDHLTKEQGSARQYRIRAGVDTGFTLKLCCSGHLARKGKCQFRIRLDCEYAEPGKLDWAGAKFRFKRSLFPCTCSGTDVSYVPLCVKKLLRDIDKSPQFDGFPMTNDMGEETFPDYQSALKVARSYGDLDESKQPVVTRKQAVHTGYYVGLFCRHCTEKQRSTRVRIYCAKPSSNRETQSFTVECKKNPCVHCQLAIPKKGQEYPQARKNKATLIPNDEVPIVSDIAKGNGRALTASNPDGKVGIVDTSKPNENSELNGPFQLSNPVKPASDRPPRVRRTDLFHKDPWVDSNGNRSFVGFESAIKALEECARSQQAYGSLFFNQLNQKGNFFLRSAAKNFRASTNPGWSQQFRCYWSRERQGGCPFMIRMKCTYVSNDTHDPNRATYELFLGSTPCNGHLYVSEGEKVKVAIDSTRVLDCTADEFKQHCSERTGVVDKEALNRAYQFFLLRKDDYRRMFNDAPKGLAVAVPAKLMCQAADKASDSSMAIYISTPGEQESNEQSEDKPIRASENSKSNEVVDTGALTSPSVEDASIDVALGKNSSRVGERVWQESPWSTCNERHRLRDALSAMLQTLAKAHCFPLLDDRNLLLQEDTVEMRCCCSRLVPCPFAVKIKRQETSEGRESRSNYQIFLTKEECLSRATTLKASHNPDATQLPRVGAENSPSPEKSQPARYQYPSSSIVRDLQDFSGDYRAERFLFRDDKINLTVQSDLQGFSGSLVSLLAPPKLRSQLVLRTCTQASSKRIGIEFDATRLHFSEGRLVQKSCCGNSKPWYCNIKQEDNTNRASAHRDCKTSTDSTATKVTGRADVSPFEGPVDPASYLLHLERNNIGSEQFWGPQVLDVDNESFDLKLSKVSTLASKTALLEASYADYMAVNASGKRSATWKHQKSDQQDQKLRWGSDSDREKRLVLLAETKSFAAVAKELDCSVGDLLVEYYGWKGAASKRDLYVAAKKRRLSESDECAVCGRYGKLIVCEGCGKAFHLGCIDPPLKYVPSDQWFCSRCTHRQEPPLSPSINWKSPTKKQSSMRLSSKSMATESQAKQNLSMDFLSRQQSVLPGIQTTTKNSFCGTIIDESQVEDTCETASVAQIGLPVCSNSFFIKPRGMIWNMTRGVWLAPPINADEAASIDSGFENVSVSSEEEERAITSFSPYRDELASSSDDETEDDAPRSKDIESSSSEEDDDEFQSDEVSDSESDTDPMGGIDFLELPAQERTKIRPVSIAATQNQVRPESGSVQYRPPAAVSETQHRTPATSTTHNLLSSLLAPRSHLGLYWLNLPFTQWGLLINVQGAKGATGACFKSYRRSPSGDIGPSEQQQLFRRSGDVILAVDGRPCENLPFAKICDMLASRARGQTTKALVMGSLSNK